VKKLRFDVETIIGDRYDSTDSLAENEIHEWLLKMQKQDILKVETENDYWKIFHKNFLNYLKPTLKRKTMNVIWLKDIYG